MVLRQGHASRRPAIQLGAFRQWEARTFGELEQQAYLSRKNRSEGIAATSRRGSWQSLERVRVYPLISIFMKRQIQPLQARPTTMWKYSGIQDASRMGRKDFADKKALEEAVHNVIKGAKTKDLPSDCPVDPYGEGIRLPKVCSLTLTISFPLIISLSNSST